MALMRILCHHLSKWSFFGTFLNTQISELRYTNANRIWSAYRVTLEPTWEKIVNPYLPKKALMRHFMSQPLKRVIFWHFLNTQI